MLKDFVIPLQSKPGAYLLVFLGGSAECFLAACTWLYARNGILMPTIDRTASRTVASLSPAVILAHDSCRKRGLS